MLICPTIFISYSLDGDADRLVYHYWDADGAWRLLDGDKQARALAPNLDTHDHFPRVHPIRRRCWRTSLRRSNRASTQAALLADFVAEE